MTAKLQSNELKLTRVYDAPVQTVWEAWTDPEKVAQWWGPRGFTLTTHSKDLRPGGHWHYTMHGPDGTDYVNKTHYFEVEEYAKLVYDHGGNDNQASLFRVTVLFHEMEGKTTMEMTMTLATPEAAAETRKFIKQAGGNATWDRLAEYLEKEDTGHEKFVMSRSFEASREVVFAMWTTPSHLTQWLPPQGFTMEFKKVDIQPGGNTFYLITNGEITIHGGAEYLEIHPPERMVYTQRFCDDQGETARHPMVPVWPEILLMRVEFTMETPETTRITLSCEPCGTTTDEEIAAFVKMRGSMTTGWTGSFDKLEEMLASLQE